MADYLLNTLLAVCGVAIIRSLSHFDQALKDIWDEIGKLRHHDDLTDEKVESLDRKLAVMEALSSRNGKR